MTKNGSLQLMRCAFYCDLLFFHGFEQGALRLGCRPVDFVGEQEMRKNRARMKLEAALIRIENRHTKNVGRQQVAGELNAVEFESERARNRLRQGRFADPGQIFDQAVATRDQATNGEFHLGSIYPG